MQLKEDDRPVGIGLGLSDPSQLALLRTWLENVPGAEVAIEPGTIALGELGGMDVLTVLAGSSGLVAAIKTLPEFIRSRRTGFRITTTIRGQSFTLDVSNVDDVLPVLERLLGE